MEEQRNNSRSSRTRGSSTRQKAGSRGGNDSNQRAHRSKLGGKKRIRHSNKNSNVNSGSLAGGQSSNSVATSSSKKPKTSEPTSRLTPNAVGSLVNFAQSTGKDQISIKGDLVVRLILNLDLAVSSKKTLLVAILDDGVHSIRVLLFNDPDDEELQNHLMKPPARKDWTVMVRGLISTDGINAKFQITPVVCLTSIKVLATATWADPIDVGTPYYSTQTTKVPHSPQPSAMNQQKSSPTKSARVRAGFVGSLLHQHLTSFSNNDLASSADVDIQRLFFESAEDGKSYIPPPEFSTPIQHSEEVQSFLTRHAAMMTLKASSQPPNSNAEQTIQNYTRALDEFASSQMDRQKASLATNAGRSSADRASQIAIQHNKALEQALSKSEEPALDGESTNHSNSTKTNVDTLTPAALCEWHSSLLNGLHAEAGQFRTKSVRTGNAVYCQPAEISTQIERFCDALSRLQQRLDIKSNALHAVLFAAVAMYGVVDIHPFADGNGRISRVVANWALRHFSFTINLFATPAQRAEYILALESTRHILTLSKKSGSVSDEAALRVTRALGVFCPIVRLMMDRIARAIAEFDRVWQEKSGLAAEALEHKAARLARERAKEGNCIICLDSDPNIATLCCGKAVHLNCIAEWLSGRNSCPCCRSELPSISGRVVRAARNVEDDDPTSGGQDVRSNARDAVLRLLSNFDNIDFGNSTTEENEEGDDTTESVNPNNADGSNEEAITLHISDIDPGDTTTEDDDDEDYSTTEMDSDTRATDNEATEEDTEEDTEDTTTTTEPATSSRIYCQALHCRNLPAVDCTNNLCGRCCVLGGEFHCPRHNS